VKIERTSRNIEISNPLKIRVNPSYPCNPCIYFAFSGKLLDDGNHSILGYMVDALLMILIDGIGTLSGRWWAPESKAP
jgi:hypothetical protein